MAVDMCPGGNFRAGNADTVAEFDYRSAFGNGLYGNLMTDRYRLVDRYASNLLTIVQRHKRNGDAVGVIGENPPALHWRVYATSNLANLGESRWMANTAMKYVTVQAANIKV